LTQDVHNISVPIRRYSPHIIGNSTTSKVIGEGTIQFQSHNGCITTLQGVHHVSMYNLISLGTLHGEGLSFSSEGDLIEVFKDAHVKF